MTRPACPICRKPQSPDYRPFCSRRCANVDLQRWLTGQYSIGGREEPEPPDPMRLSQEPPDED